MTKRIEIAKANARTAQSRLHGTAATLKARLSPRALSQAALIGAKKQAVGAAFGAAKAARSRPVISVSIFAVTALVLLRKPFISAIKRITKEKYDG